MTIGDQLGAARRQRQLTQQQVATKLHVARQTVSNWENSRSYPDIASLIALSDLYALSLDQLLKEDDQMIDDFKSKERERRQAKNLYYLSMVVAYSLLGLLMANEWQVFGIQMTPPAQYWLFAIFYVNLLALFVTSHRYRQVYHLKNQLLANWRQTLTLSVGVILLGAVGYWLDWPRWLILVIIGGFALLDLGWRRQKRQ